MASRDLELMRKGDMDRCGFHQTEKARADARAATIMSSLGFLLWSALAIALLVGKH
jgi:hypothetical protein